MQLSYVAKRIGMFFLVIWLAATINFFLPRLGGQDPIRQQMIAQAALGGSVQTGLEEMIEQERAGSRGDPQKEIAYWFAQAADAERKRSGYQDMAAEGLITLDELRNKLAHLEETRKAAEAEIGHLRGRLERVEELERNRDTLLDSYVSLIPQKLQELEPEERQQIYRMLRLRLVIDPHGGIEASGVIGAGNSLWESEITSAFTTS